MFAKPLMQKLFFVRKKKEHNEKYRLASACHLSHYDCIHHPVTSLNEFHQ